MECFKKYCYWSGQEANMEKSNLLFSKGTSRTAKRGIKRITGLNDEMNKGVIYLGNALIFGNSKTRELGRLKERVQKR